MRDLLYSEALQACKNTGGGNTLPLPLRSCIEIITHPPLCCCSHATIQTTTPPPPPPPRGLSVCVRLFVSASSACVHANERALSVNARFRRWLALLLMCAESVGVLCISLQSSDAVYTEKILPIPRLQPTAVLPSCRESLDFSRKIHFI